MIASFKFSSLRQSIFNIEKLSQTFKDKIKELRDAPALEDWERISAVIGYAIFDPFQDAHFDNTLERANVEISKDKKNVRA